MNSTYLVKSGDSLSKIAKEVYNDPSLWHQIANANNLTAPFVIQPGQELVIPQKKKVTIAIAVDGWSGGHDNVGNKFQVCRDTVVQNGKTKRWKRYSAQTIEEFFGVFDDLRKSVESVEEFHFFSHFYGNQGPQFSDGKHFISVDDVEKKILPLHWASSPIVCFHGCNSGNSDWTQKFANRQNVTVNGCAGFAVFSKRSDYWELPLDSTNESLPLYLDSFQGTTFIADQWRREGSLPKWLAACMARSNSLCWTVVMGEARLERNARLEKHCPPAKMIEVKPAK